MEDVVLAFLLTLGAGAATGIGACLPFLLKDTNSDKTLGICLGLSAGVMIYISFTEIFKESLEKFEHSSTTKNYPVLFTNLAFFSGFIICILLDYVVHFMMPGDQHLHLDPKIEDEKDTPKKQPKRVSKSIAKKRISEQLSSSDECQEPLKEDDKTTLPDKNMSELAKMSAMSALAISLHNLPEGF